MNSIMQSASKLVFLAITLTACGGFLIGKLEAKDFMLLAGLVFSFYFSYKGSPAPTPTQPDEDVGAEKPYAGK